MPSDDLLLLIIALAVWPLIGLIGGAITLWKRIRPRRQASPAP